MKVLITGSSGFIGNYISAYLVNEGFQVLGIDKKDSKEKVSGIEFKKLNILDYDKLEDAFYSFMPELVIHLAARKDLGIGDGIINFVDNTKGTENIVRVCNTTRSVKKILFTSTILVCPPGIQPTDSTEYQPTTPYGESKVYGEKVIRNSCKKSWIILRPTSIWGPSFGSHYHEFFKKINKGIYYKVKGFDPRITFGYLGNFTFQIKKLVESQDDSINNKIFYLGDYSPVNINEWALLISKKLKKGKIRHININILKLLAFMGDISIKFNIGEFPLTSYRLRNLTNDRIYNLQAIQEICPTLPYNLEEGTNETIKWLNLKNII